MGRTDPLITVLHRRVVCEGRARRLATALIVHRGDVGAAVRAIGVRSRVTAYNWTRGFPQLRALFRGIGVKPKWNPRPIEIPDSRPELIALATDAITRAEGCVALARRMLDLHGTEVMHRYLNRYPELWGVVDRARRQRRAAQGWLVKSLARLEGRPMIEQMIAACDGLEPEEIVAEIEASVHAGSVDAQALADALIAARDAGG